VTTIPTPAITQQTIIQALGLPVGCRVDQRVPKKLLLENGAPTAADKRLVTDAIDEIQWVAALKPNTIGVPEYRDEQREYLEIAVLTVTLRRTDKAANAARIAELVHRAVPYPVLLLLTLQQGQMLSLAQKRWAQNEAGKVVLDGDPVTVSLSDAAEVAQTEHDFMHAIAVLRQPQITLHTLYQGWMDCVQALLAARLTGHYQPPTTPEKAAARREALADFERYETQISLLRLQAAKETQIARQVDLNIALKRVEAELAQARSKL
jgi:hypothetical protein